MDVLRLTFLSAIALAGCEPFGVTGTLAGETPGQFLSAVEGGGRLTSVRAMALP